MMKAYLKIIGYEVDWALLIFAIVAAILVLLNLIDIVWWLSGLLMKILP